MISLTHLKSLMNNDELTKDQANAVLRALDNAIAQGPWEKSNFLKAIGKNLKESRDDFVSQMDSSDQINTVTASHLLARNERHSGQKKVCVALYSSNGKNMQSWEWIITNLPRQMVSRPIYAEEADVKAIIKTKENQVNEAYVIIYIDESDILHVNDDKIPLDKLGKPRLLLKDGALKLGNIECFVHQSDSYHYSQGRLIKD